MAPILRVGQELQQWQNQQMQLWQSQSAASDSATEAMNSLAKLGYVENL